MSASLKYRIALHSVPRSGSTWLGEVLNSSYSSKYCFQPLFSYSLKDFLNATSDKSKIDKFFSALEYTTDDFICQTEQRSAGFLPNFDKKNQMSHIIYKEVRYINILQNLLEKDESIRLVCLIRNPLAVISSWFSAPKEFNPEWDLNSEWFLAQNKNQNRDEEFYGFKRWIDASRIFHNLKLKYPDRVMIVKYADLLSDKHSIITKLFEFSSLKLEEQTLNFIEESNSKNVENTYSVFRTSPSDNQWKSKLPQNIILEIEKYLKDDPLSMYLE